MTGRADTLCSRHTSFSSHFAPSVNGHVNLLDGKSSSPSLVAGDASDSPYKVTYPSEGLYADPDTHSVGSDTQHGTALSSDFDQGSTLYMTSGVQAQLHGSLPDLLAVKQSGEGSYASLSRDVKERPVSSVRFSQFRQQRSGSDVGQFQARSSLPSKKRRQRLMTTKSVGAFPRKFSDLPTLQQKRESGGSKASQDGGYAKVNTVEESSYQALVSKETNKAEEPVAAVVPSVPICITSVAVQSDHDTGEYEIKSPPHTARRFNSYMSVSEANSTPCSQDTLDRIAVAASTTSSSSTMPSNTEVLELCNHMTALAPNSNPPKVNAAPSENSLKPPPLKPRQHLCVTTIQAPRSAAPAPPPRRDSVLRSKALLQTRQLMKCNDALESGVTSFDDAARDLSRAENRKSSSCPDLLAPSIDDTVAYNRNVEIAVIDRKQADDTTAGSFDSGVGCSEPGSRTGFVDNIQEYRKRHPLSPQPSEDYWSEVSNGPRSEASLKSDNSLLRPKPEDAQLQRPPPPSSLASHVTRSRLCSNRSMPAVDPAILKMFSEGDNYDDEEGNDAEAPSLPCSPRPELARRPTVKIRSTNRLLSETSREYWILESGSDTSPMSPASLQQSSGSSA